MKNVNPSYIAGYTKAILDFYKLLEKYEKAFINRKVVNRKANHFLRTVLDGIIAKRMGIIKNGLDHYDIALMKSGKVKFKEKEST